MPAGVLSSSKQVDPDTGSYFGLQARTRQEAQSGGSWDDKGKMHADICEGLMWETSHDNCVRVWSCEGSAANILWKFCIGRLLHGEMNSAAVSPFILFR
ncbi:hypothetical protein JZ751_000259 [Albula glossodonta]|uniref:Uncharacterized protein n=1 Tax=Albula glossodonta TaxID=121402 RepID=A0A8T2PVR3_9TELE|nr:hypothetical protein JZ751_000259 [Albula glossodonta]